MPKIMALDLQRVESIRRRYMLATAGPWVACIEGQNHGSGSSFIKTACGGIELDGATDADIEFIAAARTDISYLLDEVQRLNEVVGQKRM